MNPAQVIGMLIELLYTSAVVREVDPARLAGHSYSLDEGLAGEHAGDSAGVAQSLMRMLSETI